MSRQFEDDVLRTVEQELQPCDGGEHCSERTLGRLARRKLSFDVMEQLTPHLLTCPTCLARYFEKIQAPRWGWIRRRNAAGLGRVRGAGKGFKQLVLRYSGVVALLLAIVAIGLGVDRPSERAVTMDGVGLARGGASADGAVLTAAILVAELDALASYPPHRAAAYTLGLLGAYGVPLTSPVLAYRALDTYTTRAGDSWESVAEQALDDARLWPIVILLNLELTTEGEFVPPGTLLRIPRPIDEGEA